MTGPTTGQVASVMLALELAFFSAGQAEASELSLRPSGTVGPEGWLVMTLLWCSTLALVYEKGKTRPSALLRSEGRVTDSLWDGKYIRRGTALPGPR